MGDIELLTGYLILPIGMPGCGKGTVGKNLAQKLSAEHVSTGGLIRALPQDDPRKVLAEAGKLVPDKEVSKIALPYLEKPGTLILDGFPRTVAQYDAMIAHLRATNSKKLNDIIFIGIDCPAGVALGRLETRAIEEGRTDDQKGKIGIRMKEYETNTLPLWFSLSSRNSESGNRRFVDVKYNYEISSLGKGGYFVRVDGHKSKEDVLEDALKAILLINKFTIPIPKGYPIARGLNPVPPHQRNKPPCRPQPIAGVKGDFRI